MRDRKSRLSELREHDAEASRLARMRAVAPTTWKTYEATLVINPRESQRGPYELLLLQLGEFAWSGHEITAEESARVLAYLDTLKEGSNG